MLGCPQRCLESIVKFDMLEDVIEVCLHGMGTDAKVLGNLIIGGPHRHLGQYLCLPLGEDHTAAFCRDIFIRSLEDAFDQVRRIADDLIKRASALESSPDA